MVLPPSQPSSAPEAPDIRLSLAQLKRQCLERGLSTRGCLERADLEAVLRNAGPAPAAAQGGLIEAVREARDELESWVAYAPRAMSLLGRFKDMKLDVRTFQSTGLGPLVRRYTKHPDAAVASCAQGVIEGWRAALQPTKEGEAEQGEADRPPKPRPRKQGPEKPEAKKRARKASPARRPQLDDDDSSSDSSSSDSSDRGNAEDPEDAEEFEVRNSADSDLPGWQEKVKYLTFRRKKEPFREFSLQSPFKNDNWRISIKISDNKKAKECFDLLTQMAVDFGVMPASGQEISAEEQPMLQRLQRLEERFKGSGVTEGEARNAMRLFERELSKANWTADKFEKLKRQLAGIEEWSAADASAEGSLMWTKPCKRQAWFVDACKRVAMPLGCEFGYGAGGGCCFVGPLAAVAGAALTSSLVCHLAMLDFERARKTRGGSSTSKPQFLQGFVDGSLERDRHLVWEKLFAIQDDAEAAEFCQDALKRGFFGPVAADKTAATGDGAAAKPAGGDAAGGDEGAGNDSDLESMLRGLFSGAGARQKAPTPPDEPRKPPPPPDEPDEDDDWPPAGFPSDAPSGPPSASSSTGPARPQPRLPQEWTASFGGMPGPAVPSAPAASFKPFTGKAQRLGADDDDDGPSPEPVKPKAAAGTPERPAASESWALTFVSNIQVARSSRKRSEEQARKTFHWTRAARAVKATETGTESYTKGKAAGSKRKGDIEGTSRSVKQKFCKGSRLALTR